MINVLYQIIDHTKEVGFVDAKKLQAFIRAYNQKMKPGDTPASKRRLLELYLDIKRHHPQEFAALNIDDKTDKLLLKTLRMKPTRTASGVATIAVITKPEVCSSNCLYCPADVRMPKSYLFDEPACQRAENHFFDPYLQVAIRLTMLENMGHVTDKVELIILGGTWTDYSENYQTWFVREVFRALNDSYEQRMKTYEEKMAFYESLGMVNDQDTLKAKTSELQDEVNEGKIPFNEAIHKLYKEDSAWIRASETQVAIDEELIAEQKRNETAEHRVVGLVIETQPDTITPHQVRRLRQLGCTKAQIGIQSLNEDILLRNNRRINIEDIKRAFRLLRLYGFKIHAHFMANLYGSDPENDKREYYTFVHDEAYQPDEIKLYPCALIHGTQLVKKYEEGLWKPYSEEVLTDILVYDVLCTPPYVRISRMIREFASHNIVEGNKKVNLRELVEKEAERTGKTIQEIRSREISLKGTPVESLHLDCYEYETTVSSEKFLQWIAPDGRIAGFLRLSLPHQDYVEEHIDDLAIGLGEAMIREIHVYGSVVGLGDSGSGAQHLGLGRSLIARAKEIAFDNGFDKLNVISAVGTREYYRSLGFKDNGLYQQIALD